MTSDKRYDRAYFDRWYRGDEASRGDDELTRQAALAVAVAESILTRPIRSVLDVGAGEGRWQPAVHALRPDVAYLGIEPSAYAIEHYGGERNLRSGSFGTLDEHVFEEPFDLVVCSDVLHYLTDAEIEAGIHELADLVGGAALLELFTSADPVDGDREGFIDRPPSWYNEVFRGAGLVPLSLQMWVHSEMAEELDAMDLAQPR